MKTLREENPKRAFSAKELTEILNTTAIHFSEASIGQKQDAEKKVKERYFVCDEWECTGSENDTIHCTCKRGHWVSK